MRRACAIATTRSRSPSAPSGSPWWDLRSPYRQASQSNVPSTPCSSSASRRELAPVRVEFINFAVGMYNPEQVLAMLELRALAYQPDLVLMTATRSRCRGWSTIRARRSGGRYAGSTRRRCRASRPRIPPCRASWCGWPSRASDGRPPPTWVGSSASPSRSPPLLRPRRAALRPRPRGLRRPAA